MATPSDAGLSPIKGLGTADAARDWMMQPLRDVKMSSSEMRRVQVDSKPPSRCHSLLEPLLCSGEQTVAAVALARGCVVIVLWKGD